MAGINVKYMVTTQLQEVFVDKDTGLPLALGYLEFYKDNARTIPKHVYKLSGYAGAYTYADLGVRVDLSAGGVPVDLSGNEIRIYYYPYEIANENNIELYYVKIFDALGVERNDIQAHPNLGGSSTSIVDNIQNYIENGQFYITNNNMVPEAKIDISAYSASNIFWISGPSTQSGNGAWFFSKTNTTATDDITQKKTTAIYESSPTDYLDLNCTAAGSGETSKGLFFAQRNCRFLEGETVTISILAKSSSSSTINLFWQQNFGTGGSVSVDTHIADQSLTPTFTKYSFTFVIPSTSGMTIATNGSDYWRFGIEILKNSQCNLGLTNVQLNQGNLIFAFNPENYAEVENTFKTSKIQYMMSAEGQDPRTKEYMNVSLKTNPETGVSYYQLLDTTPVGSIVEVMHDNTGYMNDRGWIACEGRSLVASNFTIFAMLHGFMYGRQGDATATISGTDVTITNVKNGLSNNITDHNTGFTCTTVTPGGVGPQVSKVAVGTISGATLKNGSYFIYYLWPSSGGTFAVPVVMVKDFVYKRPDYTTISNFYQFAYCHYSASDTPAQLAAKVAAVYNPFAVQIPDLRGYFTRCISAGYGTSRDPNVYSRVGRPDGVAGDNLGTTQAWQNVSHYHSTTVTNSEFHADGADATFAVNATGATGYSGGDQANPINIYVWKYIKII